MFADRGIAVSCLSISARYAVVDPAEKERHFDETRRNIELAAKLDAHVLRVFGGAVPDGYTMDTILPILAENLRQIGDEEPLKAKVTLSIDKIDLSVVIDGDIELK